MMSPRVFLNIFNSFPDETFIYTLLHKFVLDLSLLSVANARLYIVNVLVRILYCCYRHIASGKHEYETCLHV